MKTFLPYKSKKICQKVKQNEDTRHRVYGSKLKDEHIKTLKAF